MSFSEFHASVDESHVYQDRLDGAALRRLREALPEGMIIDIHLGAHPYKSPVAILVTREPYATTSQYWGGDTIAEAADKCREALG